MWKVRRRGIEAVKSSAGGSAAAAGAEQPSSAASPTFESADYFVKDGRKIRVGDCALFRASDTAPFIGLIRWFKSSEEVFPKLRVSWLYRPADVKLYKGGQLITAPNEVFYSFHQDEISAGSLLHPCKVAFLRKGIQLPEGFPSYVCWRVYDTDSRCLWWLTDQDYIKERQEEVDRLLSSTWLEMHAVQQGGRSPKPLNGQPSTQQLKSGSDGAQNCSSLPTQSKGKKRERGDTGIEHTKRERGPTKEDIDTLNYKFDSMKAELMKLTEKGGLATAEAVDKLISLLQDDRNEKKVDLSGRLMLANIIAATESNDCLGRFVQLRGLPVLDDWLQEVHKGKNGDGSPKENDKSSEELLMALLRALDKLPVDLNALQTCNIGKSVNHLRTHKNMEIQKKARYLVDIWKKRVDVEMRAIDARAAGAAQPASWPGKTGFSEVPHHASRRSGEFNSKSYITNVPASKALPAKGGFSDALGKMNTSSGSAKLQGVVATPVVAGSRAYSGNVISELPVATIKEEKSSSSSQSQNNSQSCSSDHGKAVGSSLKEDARSSPARSASTSKTSGGSSRHRRSNNGPSSSGGQKDISAKSGQNEQSVAIERTPQSGATLTKESDVLPPDHANSHRLIVRFPNPIRSPARSISGVSHEDPSITGSMGSSPVHADKHDHSDQKNKVKADLFQPHMPSDTNTDSCQNCDIRGSGGSDEADRSSSAVHNGECARNADDDKKGMCVPKVVSSPSRNDKPATTSESMIKSSFNPMNALVESCVKYAEAGTPSVVADDAGMNLLASVAAGEIPKSNYNSPTSSPKSSSALGENCENENAGKPKLPGAGGSVHAHTSSNEIENADCDDHRKTDGHHSAREDTQQRSSGSLSDINSSIQDNRVSFPAKVNVLSRLNPQSALEIIGKSEGSYDGTPGKGHMLVSEANEINPNCGDRQPDGSESTSEKSNSCEKMKLEESISVAVNKENISNDKKQNVLPLDQEKSLGKSVQKSESDIAELISSDPKGSVSADIATERSRGFSKETTERKTPHGLVPVETEQCVEENIPVDHGGNAVLKGPVMGKLDFDLNEGISSDDACLPFVAPIAPSPVHLSGMSTLITHVAGGLPAPAPAKGPFISHENLLRTKSEMGWKGSAATSAFRPAEPRKLLETPKSTIDAPVSESAGKQSRPPLDIDLNVADERVWEEEASQSSAHTNCSESGNAGSRVIALRTTGFDLDLNRPDEGVENGQFIASTARRVEASLLPTRPMSLAFSSAEANSSRDFDLNNGPGVDEAGTSARCQGVRNANGLQFLPTVPGIRMNSADIGSVPPWLHPGNSYQAVTVPSILPERADQPFQYVAAPGAQRVIGPVSGVGPFGGENFRGHVLNASPSLGFPPAAPYSYAPFPFGQSFPPSSASFSVGSTPYVDSSSTGVSSFPATSQLVGLQGTLPPHLSSRPYVINLSDSTSAGHDNSRKWTRQGLDLNSDSGSADADGKEERLHLAARHNPISASPVFAEEQARVYQIPGPGLKRKEPEASWNAESSMTYKQWWH